MSEKDIPVSPEDAARALARLINLDLEDGTMKPGKELENIIAEGILEVATTAASEARAAQRREDAEAWCKLIIDGSVSIGRAVGLTGFTHAELLEANKRMMERAAAIEGKPGERVGGG